MSAILSEVEERRALSRCFAELLAYPYASPADAARRCAETVRDRSEDAAALLQAFAALAQETPAGTLQEEYTRTFDLDTMSRSQPTCYPYVGHYLFDESHKRGAFILGLKKRFRAAGFTDDDGDLPDHLVVLLRFLVVCEDEELAQELIDDAMLPALTRMLLTAEAGAGDAPLSVREGYLALLRALSLSLAAGRPERDDPLELEAEREWARSGDSLGIDRAGCGH